MPRKSGWTEDEASGLEAQFLASLVEPSRWGEARTRFVERALEALGVARDSEKAGDYRNRVEREFENLVRRARRAGWVRRVDETWRLTAAGLARLQGMPPVRDDSEGGTDDHDRALRAFLEGFLGNLRVRNRVLAAGEPREEREALDTSIESKPLFTDLKFHTDRLGLAADKDPVALYVKAGRTQDRIREQRAAAQGGLRVLLKSARVRWSFGGTPALCALEALLEGAATRTRSRVQDVPRPRWDGSLIEVAGFTLLESGTGTELPTVQEAWKVIVKDARRMFLKRYRLIVDGRRALHADLSLCEIALDDLRHYQHFPGACRFRRASP